MNSFKRDTEEYRLPPIILPIETKVREFDGKMYFAYLAAQEGFDVYVGDQARLRNYADLFPSGIYIDKSVASTRREWFEKLRAWGNSVVSWDEEGLLFFNPEMYKKLRLDKGALDIVEHFFCWGNVQKDVVISFYPEILSRIHVCGNPRFDLMREDHRDFYTQRVHAINDKYGKIILVNTNFAFCNHFKTEEELQGMLQSYPLASEDGYIDGWITYQKHGFETFTQLLPELSSVYPDHTILVRPHPSENFQPYREIAKKYPNIVVNAEGNVHEWILASDVLLHDNCTTAVEAYVLGVPAISYRTFADSRYENLLPRALSYLVETKTDLLETLERAVIREVSLMDQIWNEKNDQILDNYISGLKDDDSVHKMVGILKTAYAGQDGLERSFLHNVENYLKIQWRKLLHRYRDIRTPPDGYMHQKFPGINGQEILDVFRNFDSQTETTSRVELKKIVKDIFLVRFN